jgi:hypothetical protein
MCQKHWQATYIVASVHLFLVSVITLFPDGETCGFVSPSSLINTQYLKYFTGDDENKGPLTAFPKQ